jgi:hypothetical protein
MTKRTISLFIKSSETKIDYRQRRFIVLPTKAQKKQSKCKEISQASSSFVLVEVSNYIVVGVLKPI